ncbi:MAG: ImmA/IrrE family metallo-endopeptidase [Candidatus Omnitrophica bacterium]|nr:ImmA/IrrE family metallo-endopeptidase [Candidatus Omnitrophota bacterium]
MPDPHITFYPIAALEEIATVFLSKFNTSVTPLPIEIDLISEKSLGINIIDFSMLKEKYGLEGFLALGKKTIYIDGYLMDNDNFYNRYRFTVAEEVAHSILHGNLFKNIKDIEEYFDAFDKLKHFQVARMDQDAKYLASAILMPTEPFTELATEYIAELDGEGKVLRYGAVEKLSKKFEVSFETASIRFEQLKLDRLIA